MLFQKRTKTDRNEWKGWNSAKVCDFVIQNNNICTNCRELKKSVVMMELTASI